MEKISRRHFLKTSAVTASGLVLSQHAIPAKGLRQDDGSRHPSGNHYDYDPHGLPTAILGKTGVTIPRMAFGLGSRFCTNIRDREAATQLLEKALDSGLYYWDTASIYASSDGKVISEDRMGDAVKNNRNRIFLSTKVTTRDPYEAMRSIELSLRRLQTDRLDILNIHDVHALDDNERILKKGGLLDILYRMKEEKVTRFIGLSGHADPAALADLIEKGNFDSILFAMNHWPHGKDKPVNRREQVILLAQKKKMGIMLMKVVRPLDTIPGINAKDLIRYALSLDAPHGIAVGIDSMKVLEDNLAILREFSPMTKLEKQKTEHLLHPFFNHENLPWMDKNYRDGGWEV